MRPIFSSANLSEILLMISELSKKEALDSDADFLSRSLADALLTATFAGVDLTCLLLTFLIQVLKDVIKQFSPIVPEGVYLPAPPVYCPRPVITEEVHQAYHACRSYIISAWVMFGLLLHFHFYFMDPF